MADITGYRLPVTGYQWFKSPDDVIGSSPLQFDVHTTGNW
jgi:hypothetical protein